MIVALFIRHQLAQQAADGRCGSSPDTLPGPKDDVQQPRVWGSAYSTLLRRPRRALHAHMLKRSKTNLLKSLKSSLNCSRVTSLRRCDAKFLKVLRCQVGQDTPDSLPVRSCVIDGEAVVVAEHCLSVFEILPHRLRDDAAVMCASIWSNSTTRTFRWQPLEYRKAVWGCYKRKLWAVRSAMCCAGNGELGAPAAGSTK